MMVVVRKRIRVAYLTFQSAQSVLLFIFPLVKHLNGCQIIIIIIIVNEMIKRERKKNTHSFSIVTGLASCNQQTADECVLCCVCSFNVAI